MLIDLIADWNTKEILHEFKDHYGNDVGYFEDEKIGLPKHLPNVNYYDFYDIHTILKWKGIDPDINREEFVGFDKGVEVDDFILPYARQKYNSLWDSYVIYKCYQKLKSM